jgi:transposase
VVTNKDAKGKSGTLVAIMEGTKSENIIPLLEKIPLSVRNKVQEITLDLAGNMGLIARKCFPNASQVIDRSCSAVSNGSTTRDKNQISLGGH